MSDGTKKYAAFISYSSLDTVWVRKLQHNLEVGLEANERPGQVFFDREDLRSGSSGITQLQKALRQSERLIIVSTPDTAASSWVTAEWESFFTQAPDQIHVIQLVTADLPAFLDRYQRLDFENHDDGQYTTEFRKLLGDLLDRDRRDEVEVPELEIPPKPLHSNRRADLLEAIAKVCDKKITRRVAAGALGLDRNALETAPDPRVAARRLIERASGEDDPRSAAHRICTTLVDELDEDFPELAEPLRTLGSQLDADLRKEEDDAETVGLLGAWLTKLRDDHARLVPYFQQKTELDLLDRVYVQLELRRDAERMERMAKPGTDGEDGIRLGGPMTVRQVLDLTPNDPAFTCRWVILGDPGAGKTTLLRHLAAELARETPPTWIPVFESLPRLMREPQWILDRFERQMRRAGQPSDGLAAVLDRAGQEGRLLVLLDGLDEVPRDDRDDADALLRQVANRWPTTPILVTSRPIGFRRPGADFHQLELLPLDAPRRHEFLARWFGRISDKPDTRRATEAAKGLEADASLRELASNPLYLTLMALLIEQGTEPAANRTKLYDQVFDLLLDGKHRPNPRPIDAKLCVRQVLRHLAFEMTRDNLDAEAVEKLEARLYQPEFDNLRETLERTPRWRRSLRPFLDDLAEQTGILGEHEGPGTEWRFWHRTFREALAAEALAERHKAGGQDEILVHAREIAGDESRWAEPYALLTGWVDEPDALVKALVAENAALGLRALATAQTVDDGTIVEVLELSNDWEERSKVFLGLPDKLDDPLRTLALVDRLRQRTRNGNDLFHLDLVAIEVGQRWPEAMRQVEELRARFYDHIPAPPAELFETVETRDGRVPLWCRIPPGRFLMGSPEGEEGRDSDEGPQHQVMIEFEFWLAAVPVTQAQYAAFDPGHSHYFQGDQRPADSVTWYQTMAFCGWLERQGGFKGARLPAEEEWEYACRAGTTTRYWAGDSNKDLDRVGWFDNNSERETHPVGEKLANAWGLYDVHGNVWEWTVSKPANYSAEDGKSVDSSTLSPDLAASSRRLIRGGSCWFRAYGAGSAYRGSGHLRFKGPDWGFRVLLPFAPSEPRAGIIDP